MSADGELGVCAPFGPVLAHVRLLGRAFAVEGLVRRCPFPVAREGFGAMTLYKLVLLCIIIYALILVLLFPRVLREFRHQLKHGVT